MQNDYIHVFDLQAGLPKAQLKPFNTTPLHGIAHASLSGLESLAHDLGYAVLSPFAGKEERKARRSARRSKRRSRRSDASSKQRIQDRATEILASGGSAQDVMDDLVKRKQVQDLVKKKGLSTETMIDAANLLKIPASETVIPEIDLVLTEDDIYVGEPESSPNYTLYVIAGFVTIGAIGFGIYRYQNKKKPTLDKGRVTPALNNPLLRKLGSL